MTRQINVSNLLTRQTTTPVVERRPQRDHFPHSDLSRDPQHRAGARRAGGAV